MTTTVIVTAGEWPVQITAIDKYADRDAIETTDRVEPRGWRHSYITDTRSLVIKELPRDAPAPE